MRDNISLNTFGRRLKAYLFGAMNIIRQHCCVSVSLAQSTKGGSKGRANGGLCEKSAPASPQRRQVKFIMKAMYCAGVGQVLTGI